jgi:site-specific DNA recombinase
MRLPVLTVADWEALMALIGTNSTHGRGVNVRTYLLSGVLRCGKPECGTPLRALKTPQSRLNKQAPYIYACPSSSLGGCGGTNVHGPKADEAIEELVIVTYELEARRRGATAKSAPWPGDGGPGDGS